MADYVTPGDFHYPHISYRLQIGADGSASVTQTDGQTGQTRVRTLRPASHAAQVAVVTEAGRSYEIGWIGRGVQTLALWLTSRGVRPEDYAARAWRWTDRG